MYTEGANQNTRVFNLSQTVHSMNTTLNLCGSFDSFVEQTENDTNRKNAKCRPQINTKSIWRLTNNQTTRQVGAIILSHMMNLWDVGPGPI